MIIAHENLEREAEIVAKALSQKLGIKSEIQRKSLDNLFRRIPHFTGESYTSNALSVQTVANRLGNRALMIITPRDLYMQDKNQKEDWVLGSNYGLINFASVARLRGSDGNPRQELEVSPERYFKRLITLCLHEIGHDIVDRKTAKHMKQAFWAPVNGDVLPYGLHCTDNRCLMYEVADVKTPSRETEGCIVLADENNENIEERFDAGMDETIDRMYEGLFCGKCRSAVKISDAYK